MHVEQHFRETERLVRRIAPGNIARWLLNDGYFPEPYVLPPSFRVQNLNLTTHQRMTPNSFFRL